MTIKMITTKIENAICKMCYEASLNIVSLLAKKYNFDEKEANLFLKKYNFEIANKSNLIEKTSNKSKTNLKYKAKANGKVLTEDLGKIFEMAICMTFNTEFNGNYKYSLDEANKIKVKLDKLLTVFPFEINHIAKNGNQYDFQSVGDNTQYLSAKTTKKDGKVCPQVIGQPSKKKFCEYFGISLEFTIYQIKEYIENNIKLLLDTYLNKTFDCPIVYYNKDKNKILFINLKEKIEWANFDILFSHIIKNKKWNESSTVIIGNTSIGEFQIHNHRDNIKFRWSFEKLLLLFKDNFEIIELFA